MRNAPPPPIFAGITLLLLLLAPLPPPHPTAGVSTTYRELRADASPSNLTAALDRLVTLVAAGGSALLALVWARVALSWFSHDVSKKIQAKERARDALVGTLIFVGALTGVIGGLAHWVLTGT